MVCSVDQGVGRQMRHLRWKNGKTVEDLALEVGLPLEQVKRFESGEERVRAQHLWRIAGVFGVPIKTFFPLPEDTCAKDMASVEKLADAIIERETIKRTQAKVRASSREQTKTLRTAPKKKSS